MREDDMFLKKMLSHDTHILINVNFALNHFWIQGFFSATLNS